MSCKLQSAALVSKEFQGTGQQPGKLEVPSLGQTLARRTWQFEISGWGWGLLVISIMHCSQENSYARQGTMSLSQYISSALPSDSLCRRGSGAIQPPTKTPPPRPQPLPQFSLAPLITLTSDFEIGETAALKAGLGRAACDLNLLFISQRAGSVNRTRNITAPAVILCHRDQKASRPSRITFLLWAPKHLLIQAL